MYYQAVPKSLVLCWSYSTIKGERTSLPAQKHYLSTNPVASNGYAPQPLGLIAQPEMLNLVEGIGWNTTKCLVGDI